MICPLHHRNVTVPQLSSVTLRTGNLHLELLALALNSWSRSHRHLGSVDADRAEKIMTLITALPPDLQVRAIAVIYGADPESLVTGETSPEGRENRSTGAKGFTEDGTPEDYDVAAGSVLGYRSWKLRCEPHYALSGAYGTVWSCPVKPGYRYTATCHNRSCRNVPNEDNCGCGFWAYWLPQDGVNVTYNHDVVGVIEGSGKVIIAEKGFRSKYAVIRGLAPRDGSQWLSNLADFRSQLASYHVPMHDSVAEMRDALGIDPVYSPGVRDLAAFVTVPSRELELYLALLESLVIIIGRCATQSGNLKQFSAFTYGKDSHRGLRVSEEQSLVSTALAQQRRRIINR